MEAEEALLPPTSDWFDRLISDGFVTSLGCILWGINAYFTVTGLQSIGLPATLIGTLVGIGFHVGISKAERNLWKGEVDWLARSFGLLFLLIDAGTAIAGQLIAIDRYAPAALGATPRTIRDWGTLFGFITGQPWPNWAPQAAILILIAILIALIPEPLTAHFWRRTKRAWRRRPRRRAAP